MLEKIEIQWLLSFQAVYRHLSFKQAALELELPKSNVSRHVAMLEQQLGSRLLERTTRKMVATDAGKQFYASIGPLLTSLEDSLEEMGKHTSQIGGHLKVITPDLPFLADIFAQFCVDNSQITFSCETQLNPQDGLIEGYDVMLCFSRGKLADSNWVAREVMRWSSTIVASPNLIAQTLLPTTVNELTSLPCITTLSVLQGQPWHFKYDNVINVQSNYKVNSGQMAKAAALKGLGFAILPSHACEKELDNGSLIEIKLEQEPEDLVLYALYSGRHQPKRKVKVFIDYIINAVKHF